MVDLIPWIEVLARLAVGGVLIVAGLRKIRDVKGFASVLSSYRWLPASWRSRLAFALPASELLVGAGLLSGILFTFAVGLAVFLFVAFAAVYAATFGWKGTSDCGCFGQDTMATTPLVVARNLSLSLLASIAWLAGFFDGVEGAAVPLIVGALASLGVLVMTLLPVVTPEATSDDPIDGNQRRLFLRLVGGATVGMVAAAFLGISGRVPTAEAACYGCGSCGTDYVFLYCSAPCCGAYIVKPWNYCQTGCISCSQTVKVYCGVSACC